MGEIVAVARVQDSVEANLMLNRLQEAGIEARLADENTVATVWYFSNALGGIKVLVAAEDAERARALLGTHPGSDERSWDEADFQEGGSEEFPEDRPESLHPPAARTENPPLPIAPAGTVPFSADADEEDETRKPTTREKNADRALRCSVAALLFWPLMVYSLGLVGKVYFSNDRLEGNHRRNAWWAALLTLPAVGILYVVYLVSPAILERFRADPPAPETLQQPVFLVGRWETADPTPGRPFLRLELDAAGFFRYVEAEGLAENSLEGTWGSDRWSIHFRVRGASTTWKRNVGAIFSWDLLTRRPGEITLRTMEGKIRLRKVGD